MELQTIWERNLATQRAIDSAPNEEDQQAEATTHHELLIEAPALDPVPAAGNMAKSESLLRAVVGSCWCTTNGVREVKSNGEWA